MIFYLIGWRQIWLGFRFSRNMSDIYLPKWLVELSSNPRVKVKFFLIQNKKKSTNYHPRVKTQVKSTQRLQIFGQINVTLLWIEVYEKPQIREGEGVRNDDSIFCFIIKFCHLWTWKLNAQNYRGSAASRSRFAKRMIYNFASKLQRNFWARLWRNLTSI